MKRILIRASLADYSVCQSHTEYVDASLSTDDPYYHEFRIRLFGSPAHDVNDLYELMKPFEDKRVSIYALRDDDGYLTANISDIADMDPEWIEPYLKEEELDYVPFNADRRLGQNQYVSRYARGISDVDLGVDLRWKNLHDGNYHIITIHKDDLVEFHRRVKLYKKNTDNGIDDAIGFMHDPSKNTGA